MVSDGVQADRKNVRIRTWKEFRKLALKRNPVSIVYIIARGIPASNLTSLKLILPLEGMQYIFVDSAKGNRLRQTGIPIRSDLKGNFFLEDEDVKEFLKTQLTVKNLQIFSYWTI